MSNNPCTNSRVKAKTLPTCKSRPIQPNTVNKEDYVAKIPVVIAEQTLNIDVEADIYLEHPAIEIKRILKTTYLTQAKLLVTDGYDRYGCPRLNGKLFIKGYVRKNIEYATCECSNQDQNDCCCGYGNVVSGDILHTTVDVPFHCIAEIDEFLYPPVLNYKGTPKTLVIFKGCKNNCYGNCGPDIYGVDDCQYHSRENIPYNEDFDVEIENVRIVEVDYDQELILPEGGTAPTYPRLFNKVTEKLDLTITLKILQKQQIKIPAPRMEAPKPHCGCKY